MKRIHLIFGLAGVLFAACAHAQPTARELARDDGSRIRYYLEPRDPARRSDRLLLVIQGSDCNSVTRVRIIQSDLVRAWPQADLLTVEKYGIDDTLPYDGDPERPDCPAAYLERDNLQQRASDLDAVLTELRRTWATVRSWRWAAAKARWSRTCWRRARAMWTPPSPSMAADNGS
ncbi:hypothetical protein WJ970_11655 [Achromobacter xylosoxidans]